MNNTTNIKELRDLTGLSQQKFCDKYGIPRRTLQSWELEERKPPEYVISLLKKVIESENNS